MDERNGIHRLFEVQAHKTPDRPAVITDRATVTYGELESRANRLARHLLEGGLRARGTVAVSVGRQPGILVAVLAVLKAGGVYAVVGPHEPTGGTGRLLGRTGAGVVVTCEEYRHRVDDGRGRRIVCLDADAAAIAACSSEPLDLRCHAAAVLLTAGASGERRPVGVEHWRLREAYRAWAEVYRLAPADRHLVTAPPDTAAFTGGWIRALCSGAALVLPVRPAGPGLWGLPVAEGVSVLDTDPVTAASLLEARPPDSLRLVTVSGERLTLAEQVRLHSRLAPGARLLNVYGPAEVAGCGTWFSVDQLRGPVSDPERLSLLGRPFPGCEVEVRDGTIRLMPPEGGERVATGDLGVLREDGLLEYRGRLAHRITLRGRTVDPYPAEAALASHPDIREAVITGSSAVDSRGQRRERLVAYVVPRSGAAPGAAAIRTRLTGVVPEAEIPDTAVALPSLPRDRTGKVDRHALPRPRDAAGGGAGGKGGKGGSGQNSVDSCAAWILLSLLAFFLAALLTDPFWPGSTDLSGVPRPWSRLFVGLYAAEWLAFAVGVAFLFKGRAPMLRQGRPRGLTTAAHLAIGWLLVSWWPQDNFYRLAAKNDWPRQAALVYVFNIPLMIAAAVVAVYAVRRPGPPDGPTA